MSLLSNSLPESWAVFGSQWGDEGKGKIIDELGKNFDIVVRFQGGNNAGHTLILGDKKIILRLLPSGMMREHMTCFIAGGVVVSLPSLLEEIALLEDQGMSDLTNRIRLSESCPLVLPYHIALDEAHEQATQGPDQIGTTKKGIGPCYADDTARRGLRVGDLYHDAQLKKRLYALAEIHNTTLHQVYGVESIDPKPVLDELRLLRERIRDMVGDLVYELYEAHKQGKRILFEGAQGTGLDLKQGSYPYVTSSCTTMAGLAAGAGIHPRLISETLGVTKVYATRVGAGPFPTEQDNQVGAKLAKLGHEFGSVTGRPRRCGWLDLPALHRSAWLNGFTSLCLTKLDVLDSFDTIRVCVAYEYQGRLLAFAPQDTNQLSECTPVYKDFSGWCSSTLDCTTWDGLPKEAQALIRFVEQSMSLPIKMIATGPKRGSLIHRVSSALPEKATL